MSRINFMPNWVDLEKSFITWSLTIWTSSFQSAWWNSLIWIHTVCKYNSRVQSRQFNSWNLEAVKMLKFHAKLSIRFIYTHTLKCVRADIAAVRLHRHIGSSEISLVASLNSSQLKYYLNYHTPPNKCTHLL